LKKSKYIQEKKATKQKKSVIEFKIVKPQI